jgi:hypothetical protein
MRVNARNLSAETDQWNESDWRYFAQQLAREYETVVREWIKDSPRYTTEAFPRLGEAARLGLL